MLMKTWNWIKVLSCLVIKHVEITRTSVSDTTGSAAVLTDSHQMEL